MYVGVVGGGDMGESLKWEVEEPPMLERRLFNLVYCVESCDLLILPNNRHKVIDVKEHPIFSHSNDTVYRAVLWFFDYGSIRLVNKGPISNVPGAQEGIVVTWTSSSQPRVFTRLEDSSICTYSGISVGHQ